MADLFGNPCGPDFGALTDAERRRIRRRTYAIPRGYADKPGSGPENETCGSCRHHATRHFAKVYHKCKLNQASWTGGPKTDIRVRSPACSKWEADEKEAYQG